MIGLQPEPRLEAGRMNDGQSEGTEPSRETAGVPSSLTERPQTRLWWLGGWLAAALACGLLAVAVQLPPEEQSRARIWLGAAAVTLVAIGLLGLRMGIVANQRGVRVSTVFTHTTVAWSDLADIEVEEVLGDVPTGTSRLVFVRRSGPPVVAPVMAGQEEPGSSVLTLQRTLLSMRDAHAPRR
jgi:hypothetical protein